MVIEDYERPETPTVTGGTLNCKVNKVTLTATGSEDVSYSWYSQYGAQVGNTKSIEVFDAGWYQVIVTGVNGCSSYANIYVERDYGPPIYVEGGGNLGCEVSEVTLTAVSPSHGVTFKWLNLGNQIIGEGINLVVTTPGPYKLQGIDLNGCTSESTFSIGSTSGDFPLNSKVQCIDNQGTVAISPSPFGPYQGPYLYSINGGEFSYNGYFTGLSNGTYEFTVKNSSGCISTITATVDCVIDCGNEIRITGGQQLNCATRTVQLTANGAPEGAVYNWTGPGVTATTKEINVNIPGSYEVIVTAPNGCKTKATAVVTQDFEIPEIPTITISGGPLNCKVDKVTLAAKDLENVTYSWYRYGTIIGNTKSIEVSEEGHYEVLVTDPNGCSSPAYIYVERDYGPLIHVEGIRDLDCEVSEIKLTAFSPSQGVAFKWLNGENEIIGEAVDLIVTSHGPYRLQAIDLNGCVNEYAFSIYSKAGPGSPLDAKVECIDNLGRITISSLDPFAGPHQYSMNGGAFSSNRIFSDLSNGIYEFSVKDKFGCLSTIKATVDCVIGCGTEVTVTAGKLICTETKIMVTAAATGDGIIYKWTVPAGVTDPGNVASFETSVAGVYKVEVTSSNSCKATGQIEVQPGQKCLTSKATRKK